MFIGDGAKLVRDAFALAKEKSPCIIFIDEIDAIGTKRFDSEVSGDREVQRTMLELLNQLDGFSSDDNIKVATASFCKGGNHMIQPASSFLEASMPAGCRDCLHFSLSSWRHRCIKRTSFHARKIIASTAARLSKGIYACR